MKALDLSRQYFNDIAFPAFKDEFPDLINHMAAGLIGNGSECFGYDDELSRDHDWGVDFFIWLSESDRERIPELANFKENLFIEYPPEFKRERSEYGAFIDVMTTGDFYRQLIGFTEGPDKIQQWRAVPEENLAMAVNGEVFYDGDGQFIRVREKLLRHYPEDLRRKKMAARCMAIAQTGQYNFMRMLRRDDRVVVKLTLSRFIENVTGLVFLLNKTYRPFYKWAYRRMKELPLLGESIGRHIYDLSSIYEFFNESIMHSNEIISYICNELAIELRRQELTSTNDWFFTSHGEELQRSIKDEFLASLPAQYE